MLILSNRLSAAAFERSFNGHCPLLDSAALNMFLKTMNSNMSTVRRNWEI